MNTQFTHDRRTKLTFAGVIALLGASLVLTVSAWGDSNADAHATHSHSHATVIKKAHNAKKAKKAKKAKTKVRINRVKVRKLYLGMRSLWHQHMMWTYATVTAFVSDSPGLEPTLNRLLANQKHLGNAIKPYYGRAAGNRLTTLLTEHIELAVPVLVAAKAGDNVALGKAVEDWYRNARQVGNFLARTNPAWKSARGMMKEHITQTVAYASDQLQGDFARSIKDYDAAEMYMVMLGDQISAGIVKKFPRRFRARRFR